jgi:D-glycero-alpha-D-manno-heptose-7-phosphate kinase
MASLVEQDMSVSITGTQEQSNVIFGGVCDYVWFPWGVPSQKGSFGSSIRFELIESTQYSELTSRLRLYHTGQERASTDVNSVWRDRLSDDEGYDLHRKKLDVAYNFREGLRLMDWERVAFSFRNYRSIRTQLCSDYMTSECWDIQGQCESFGAEMFPLGAGGGGAVVVVSPEPKALIALDEVLRLVYRPIDFSLRQKGHETENLSFFGGGRE